MMRSWGGHGGVLDATSSGTSINLDQGGGSGGSTPPPRSRSMGVIDRVPHRPPNPGGSGGGRGGSWWGHGGSTPGYPPRTPSGRGSDGGSGGVTFGGPRGTSKSTPPDPPQKGGFWGTLQNPPKNLKKWGRRLSATFGSKKVAEGALHLLKVAQKKPLIRRSDPQNRVLDPPRTPQK
jgi:hypothetical protein